MRESSGGVVYERKRKDVKDVTIVVLTRCDVLHSNCRSSTGQPLPNWGISYHCSAMNKVVVCAHWCFGCVCQPTANLKGMKSTSS